MKTLKTALCLIPLLAACAAQAAPARPQTDSIRQDAVWHGGGCRKSSPPGKCCHLKRATGTVHCH